MGAFIEELDDALTETSDVTQQIEADLTEAFDVEFEINIQNIDFDHSDGPRIRLEMVPDTDAVVSKLNDVTDDQYEEVRIRQTGGLTLYIQLPDEDT